MGDPIITHDTFWSTYQQLLQKFNDHCTSDPIVQEVIARHDDHFRSIHEEDPGEILPGLRELRNSADAVGSAADMTGNLALVFKEPECADFTDDDEMDDGDGP